MKNRGYMYIGAAALMWGISATLGRAVFTGRLPFLRGAMAPIDPLILSQSRVTFSFFAVLAVLAYRRGWAKLNLSRRDQGNALLLGVFGVAVGNYFYYFAVQKTNVATAIILQYTAPIWVLLYTTARGLQKPSRRRAAGAVLAVAGIWLVVGGAGVSGAAQSGLGVTVAFLSAFSFSFYNIAGHRILSRHDHWKILLWTLGGASLFWLLISPPWRVAASGYSREQWLFLLGFSVISMLAPFSFYFAGLRHLEPTRAIVTSCLEPVFSIVIAAAALGEVLRPAQALGIVVVLASIVLVQLPERGVPKSPAVMEPID